MRNALFLYFVLNPSHKLVIVHRPDEHRTGRGSVVGTRGTVFVNSTNHGKHLSTDYKIFSTCYNKRKVGLGSLENECQIGKM
jgi:hypothetical protein